MSRELRELPPDSVGAIVRPAWGRRAVAPSLRCEHGPAPGSIASEVLAVRGSVRVWLPALAGLALAAGLHGGALAAALVCPASAPAPTKPALVVVQHEVELAEPAPAEPEEPVEEPVRSTDRAQPVQSTNDVVEAAPDTPPPAAEAGEVMASEALTQPLDFTGFDIATGGGARYAGGVTAASGTSTRAVRARRVERRSSTRARVAAGPDLSRSVSLPARNWSCPWPSEAEAIGIDAQVVVLRASVGEDGRVSAVDVLEDPGSGFGQAARRCALQARFEPALDRFGKTVAATSPPIRVRFTR